jgi:aminoglycoside 6-adenylyltransferase
MSDEELEQATIEWAQARPDIRAVLAIGSRARGGHPADEWSDLDLIILTTDSGRYANDAWLPELGTVWVALVEEANPGDPDVQVIFEGGLGGDFTFVTVRNAGRPLNALLEELSYQGVLSRGARVLFDRSGPPRMLPEQDVAAPGPPSEEEYRRLVNGFWLYANRVAKYTRREDLWRATFNLTVELNRRLLTLMEWHAKATGSPDTWYGGRFMEEWADPRALEALPGIFPHYDADDLRQALTEAIELFRILAQETAAHLGYDYPSEMDRHISRMIRES